MAECKEKLFTEFPPINTNDWVEKVTADLKGADFNKKLVWKTNEGFSLQPMYRAEDIESLKTTSSQPGEYPFVRGTKCDNDWLVRQDIEVLNVKDANEKAIDLLQKGVSSLGFKLSEEQITVENLSILLQGICPETVELNFATCIRNAAKLATSLSEYYKAKNINTEKAKGSINFAPYKRILKRGKDVANATEMITEVISAAKALPKYRVLSVDATLFCNAGSYITQELGYALSWGNEYLASMTDAGMNIDDVAKRIKFNFGISSNFFMEIAKFRAARLLWAQIVSQYKPACTCASKMKTHAVTSEFNKTIYDAHVNLLRSQTEAMSAALGGVDSMTVTGFDTAYQKSDDFAERIARNQQLLLREEAHFDKVIDPAGGSYYLETLTVSIAEQAWKLFIEIEEKGGFYAALKSGYIQEQINNSAKARLDAISKRKEILLGTNQYPNTNEKAAGKIKIEEETCCCNGSCSSELATLNIKRGASEFETMRLATEHAAKRPKVFMLTIGNLAMRLARSQFSGNFFGCAGYEIIDNLGFDTVQAGIDSAMAAKADIVVLCSSDEEYATLAPEAKTALGEKAILVIAGAPECMDELKAQGIDQFINVRSNVLDTLKAFNAKLLK